MKPYAADGDAALKTGSAPATTRESVKEKNPTGKLIYLLLRDGVTGLQSSSAAGHFLFIFFVHGLHVYLPICEASL